ncbi:hypothetical protein DEDE109153_11640 [Deinococcus deserti]
MIVLDMLRAFLGAAGAGFGTEPRGVSVQVAAAHHQLGCQGADIRTITVQTDTFAQHVDF